MKIKLETLLNKTITDELIAFQTDTVYGVGCLLHSQKGIEKIYALKGRDNDKPLPVLCASIDDAKQLVEDYEKIKVMAETHWPGALTLVTKKTPLVPDEVTKKSTSVGLRIPNDNVALAILEKFGPMAVTSLNISTEPAVLTYKAALAFADRVDYLVEGIDLNAVSSTVYDVENEIVLRQGEIQINH